MPQVAEHVPHVLQPPQPPWTETNDRYYLKFNYINRTLLLSLCICLFDNLKAHLHDILPNGYDIYSKKAITGVVNFKHGNSQERDISKLY